MRVHSTVNIHNTVVKRIERAKQVALAKTVEALHTDVTQSQVVPRDQGTLQNEAAYVDLSELPNGRCSLIYATPYARRLYYHPEYHYHKEPWESTENGKVVQHDGNPNAKGKWLEDYISGSKDGFVEEQFLKHLKEEL